MNAWKPSWRSLWIVGITVVLALIARSFSGWAGWWILISGLVFGYFVAAIERTDK